MNLPFDISLSRHFSSLRFGSINKFQIKEILCLLSFNGSAVLLQLSLFTICLLKTAHNCSHSLENSMLIFDSPIIFYYLEFCAYPTVDIVFSYLVVVLSIVFLDFLCVPANNPAI